MFFLSFLFCFRSFEYFFFFFWIYLFYFWEREKIKQNRNVHLREWKWMSSKKTFDILSPGSHQVTFHFEWSLRQMARMARPGPSRRCWMCRIRRRSRTGKFWNLSISLSSFRLKKKNTANRSCNFKRLNDLISKSSSIVIRAW